MAIYGLFLLSGHLIATLSGILNFMKGGNSKWLAALLINVRFPVLIPFIFIWKKVVRPKYKFSMEPAWAASLAPPLLWRQERNSYLEREVSRRFCWKNLLHYLCSIFQINMKIMEENLTYRNHDTCMKMSKTKTCKSVEIRMSKTKTSKLEWTKICNKKFLKMALVHCTDNNRIK